MFVLLPFLTIVLSVLQFTVSDYPFCIFKLFLWVFELKIFRIFIKCPSDKIVLKYIWYCYSWYDIPELNLPIMISLINGWCLQRSYWTKGYPWLNWSHYDENFTVATMPWLTVTESLCHKLPRICSICRNHNLVLSSFINVNIEVLTRIIRRWHKRNCLPHPEFISV